MEQVPEGRTECKGSETLFSLICRLGLGQDLVSRLEKRERGALRKLCRDGQTLVNANQSELTLAFPLEERLNMVDSWRRVYPRSARRRAQLLESRPRDWASLLGNMPLCTSLCFYIGDLGEHAEQLLAPFYPLPDATARITTLKMWLGNYQICPLAASFPDFLAHMFPSLLELELDGRWKLPDARGFYAGVAQHLPRLQRLRTHCPDGLEHVALLPPSLTQLRELSIGDDCSQACNYADVTKLSAATATALGSFPQLRMLCIFGMSLTESGTRHLLRHGLASSLEQLIVGGWEEPWLVLTAAAAGGAGRGLDGRGSLAAGGGADGGARVWDAALGYEEDGRRGVHADQLAALMEVGVPLRRLRMGAVGADIANSPLLQPPWPCRQMEVQVGHLYLSGDHEAARLGELLRLVGAPEELTLVGMRRRGSLAGLEGAVAELLAPRLKRIVFERCVGLTPAELAVTLAALPRVEEVVLVDCSRFGSLGRCGEAVSRLLDAVLDRREQEEREGEGAPAMVLRRLRVEHGWRARSGRPLPEDDESGDEDEGAWWMADDEEEDEAQVGLRVRGIVRRAMWRVAAPQVAEELDGALRAAGLEARVELSWD